MKNLVFLFTLSISLVLVSVQAFAEPILIENSKPYSISGLDPYDLNDQIEILGPKTPHGKPLQVRTLWDVKWQYQLLSEQNRCSLSAVKTTLKVQHTTPEWTNEGEASQNLKQAWHVYLEAVSRYTRQHKKIGYQAAKKIEDTLLMMRSETNCVVLHRNAEILSERILKNYQNMASAYDERSEFGRSEGLTLR